MSDNGSNVAAAHEVKYIVRCANILTKYFKNSTLELLWLNEAIKSKNIEDKGLKTYIKIRWMTVYKCVYSVWRLKDALQHFFDNVRVISDSLKPIKEAIFMLKRTYKKFDEDIYLLAFFLHPQYKGADIHNTQFERIQKTALNIWKNLNHKKTSGLELKAQLYNSLSRLAKIVFSITPHSASYKRLFLAFGWMFGKKRTNLNVQTIECISKIYTYNIHSLLNGKKSLNHNSISSDDVQKMINTLFEEGGIYNEDEDKEEYEEFNIEKESVDEVLNIKQMIDLELWVYIESSEIPFMFNNKYDSENDDDWNPEEII
ncbi:hypothetical protein C1646_765565 [Rhizophagus diaphanus]|nr:hypothetical protein C1646_765565 [Rhizophagus diaphanus] [Rhizophagus sp. MUCL 43196]